MDFCFIQRKEKKRKPFKLKRLKKTNFLFVHSDRVLPIFVYCYVVCLVEEVVAVIVVVVVVSILSDSSSQKRNISRILAKLVRDKMCTTFCRSRRSSCHGREHGSVANQSPLPPLRSDASSSLVCKVWEECSIGRKSKRVEINSRTPTDARRKKCVLFSP